MQIMLENIGTGWLTINRAGDVNDLDSTCLIYIVGQFYYYMAIMKLLKFAVKHRNLLDVMIDRFVESG